MYFRGSNSNNWNRSPFGYRMRTAWLIDRLIHVSYLWFYLIKHQHNIVNPISQTPIFRLYFYILGIYINACIPIIRYLTYEMESEINWDKNVWITSVVWCSLVRCIIKPTATQQTCVRRKEPKQKMEEGKRISQTRRALMLACKTYALKVFYWRIVYSSI